jgi:hypothetical protein
MNKEKLKKHLPTLMNHLERRRRAATNRLPKHLRPLPLWPIVLQMVLNLSIVITLATLMIERDDFVTEAAPAVGLVGCLLLLIYTLISALQLKQRYQKIPGHRLAVINLWMMGLAALMFPMSVAYFLP